MDYESLLDELYKINMVLEKLESKIHGKGQSPNDNYELYADLSIVKDLYRSFKLLTLKLNVRINKL